jgi:hypothetical protein
MRQSEIWTVDLHAFRVLQEPGDEAAGQGKDFVLDPAAMKDDDPSHSARIAYSLYNGSRALRIQSH